VSGQTSSSLASRETPVSKPAVRGVLLAISLALACAVVMPLGAQPLSPELIENIGLDQKLGDQLPLDLVFADEKGVSVTLGDYFGDKPVVLSLVYYECPMLCTQVLNGLLRSLRVLKFDVGNEFDVVTVSFDPRETPDLAASKKEVYVRRYGRDDAHTGWHFLTGSQDQIDRLAQAVGFRYEYDEESGEYIHASGIMVVTPGGTLARYLYGIDYAPKDLQLALIESASEKIGSAVDQLLLLCYQYDPATGKYGFAIMNSLRIGGGATVIAIGAFVVVMLRRDRRNAAKGSFA
jgi:protein SCO1/2